MDISIFFPAYNEEANIKNTVEKAVAIIEPLVKNYEVIIINDGSRDKTGEIAKGLSDKDPNIHVIHHERNRGYGAALKTGFYNSRFHWIAFAGADGQFDFLEITKFLEKTNDYDLIIGWRGKRADPFIRKINAKLFALELRFLFGLKVKDVDCGFKLIKKKVIDKIEHLESEGAMIDAELLIKAKRAGFKITEVPVKHLSRKAGRQTGANLKVIWRGAVIEPLRLLRKIHKV